MQFGVQFLYVWRYGRYETLDCGIGTADTEALLVGYE